jgi:Secretion system C-terminal sorting domain
MKRILLLCAIILHQGVFSQVVLDSTFGNAGIAKYNLNGLYYNGLGGISNVGNSLFTTDAFFHNNSLHVACIGEDLIINTQPALQFDTIPRQFNSIHKLTNTGVADTMYGYKGDVIFRDVLPHQFGALSTKITMLNSGSTITVENIEVGPYIRKILIRKHFANGAIDYNFGNNGVLDPNMEESQLTKYLFQRNNFIYVASHTHLGNGATIKSYDTLGNPNLNFGNNGVWSIDTTNYLMFCNMDVSGNILIVYYNTLNFTFYKIAINANGIQNTVTNSTINLSSSYNFATIRYGNFIPNPDSSFYVWKYYGDNGPNDETYFFLTKYKQNGEIDSSYANNGVLIKQLENSVDITDVLIDHNSIYITGYQDSTQFLNYRFIVGKLDLSGNVDTSFYWNGYWKDTASIYNNSSALGLIKHSGNRILAYGNEGQCGSGGIVLVQFIDKTEPISTAGLEEKDQIEFSLYPNPANNFLRILNESSYAISDVFVHNQLGELISIPKANNEELNITSLSSGIYYLSVTFSNGSTSRRKFVKN